MSGFPLSVGTGLALESCFKATATVIDPDRKIPNTVNISDYNVMVINAHTLIRNIYQSLDKQIQPLVKSPVLLNTLLSEIETIRGLLHSTRTDLVVYVEDYLKLKDSEPSFVLRRVASTVQQKVYDTLQHEVSIGLTKQLTDTTLNLDKKYSVLMITHIPRDLVHASGTKQLHLLESHTGKLKRKEEWGSKYFKVTDNDLTRTPFHLWLLYIFGDHVMYRPQKLATRKAIIHLSEQYKWNPLTTLQRIKQCVKLSNDPELLNLKEYL
jgi:hypothetical protein